MLTDSDGQKSKHYDKYTNLQTIYDTHSELLSQYLFKHFLMHHQIKYLLL